MTLDDLLAAKTGGPPRFFSPIIDTRRGAECAVGPATPRRSRAWCTSRVADGRVRGVRAVRRLSEDFELSCLNVPVGDRSVSTSSCGSCASTWRPRNTRLRTHPSPFSGESMGGLIALGVGQATGSRRRARAREPGVVFDRSPWPAVGPALPLLPETLYEGLPYALAPILFDPPRLLRRRQPPPPPPRARGPRRRRGRERSSHPPGSPPPPRSGAPLPRARAALRHHPAGHARAQAGRAGGGVRVRERARRAGELRRRVPSRGDSRGYYQSRWQKTQKRPSARFGHRLRRGCAHPLGGRGRALGAAHAERRVRGGNAGGGGASHAALQESGVDLMEILRLNGFAPRRASDPVSLTKDELHAAVPEELEKAFDGGNGLRSVVSPVFFSTRDDGTIIPGLGAVPFEENRPVLLVGNHQTIAPDLGFIIEAFIKERGVLPRGLAHPVVAGGGFGAGAAARGRTEKRSRRRRPPRDALRPPRPARRAGARRARAGVGRCASRLRARRRRDEPSRRRRRRRRFEPVHRVRRGSRLRQEPVQASRRRRVRSSWSRRPCARRSSARTRSTLFSGRHGPSSCAWRRGTAP